MRFNIRFIAILTVMCLATTAFTSAGEVDVLIVDGQNNHNWKATTPVMKSILEEVDIFTVDVATSPSKGKDMSGFKPDFSKYDTILLNYNGNPWPAETKKNFEEFVRSGGGVVCVHAADNSFPKWKAYNEIIGVGGWGGRNEKSGPKLRWEDGKIIRDTSKGRGGSHGSGHSYPIDIRVKDHPITAGLPERWMHAREELYDSLRGPAKNLTVLATAWSDPKQRGTGNHEPMLMTISYGKGRCFHITLGHGPACMHCVGFVTLLRRGTEWAATGKVTRKEVPADFPDADTVRLWKPFKRQKLADELKASLDYELGGNADKLKSINETVKDSYGKPDRRATIEAMLLDSLNSSKASRDFKRFIFRQLWMVGSKKSVPTLARMLSDEESAHMARLTLEHIPGDESTRALRDAIGKVRGDLLIGVINTLGRRGDREAVGAITKLLQSRNSGVAAAAASALGKTGGEKAAEALAGAMTSARKKLRAVIIDARLRCADGFVESGDKAAARAIYDELHKQKYAGHVRAAALRGLISLGNEDATKILARQLTGDDANLRSVAMGYIIDIPGEDATRVFAGLLPNLSPDAQAPMLDALARRGDKAALPAVVKASKHSNEEVRVAAFSALGSLGDASSVPLLLKAAGAGGEEAAAAAESLARLEGAEVNKAVLDAARTADGKAKLQAVKTLVARRMEEGVPVLLSVAKEGKPEVRREAFEALSELAGPEALPRLVKLMVEAGDASAEAAEKAVMSVASKVSDESKRCEALLGPLSRARGSVKASLLRVLGKFGGAEALKAMEEALDDDDKDIVDAAVRSLANWPDAGAVDVLLDVVRNADSKTHRVLALRGFIRSLGMAGSMPVPERLAKFKLAMSLAKNNNEKKLVLGGVGSICHPKALEFAEAYTDDEAVKAEAEAAVAKIKKALSGPPVVSASHNSGKAKNAIDGKLGTRWDTGTPMRNGMWFMLDMRVEQQVGRIELDTSGSKGDYPRGYEVYLSSDGESWGDPVASGEGKKPKMTITFKPRYARFVKIVQTGKTDGLFWSIHELSIKKK